MVAVWFFFFALSLLLSLHLTPHHTTPQLLCTGRILLYGERLHDFRFQPHHCLVKETCKTYLKLSKKSLCPRYYTRDAVTKSYEELKFAPATVVWVQTTWGCVDLYLSGLHFTLVNCAHKFCNQVANIDQRLVKRVRKPNYVHKDDI